MKITGVETYQVSLPVRRAHAFAGNLSPIGQGYIVVKLHVEGGVVGLGEAQVLKDWAGEYGSRYGEAPETTATMIERMTDAIDGLAICVARIPEYPFLPVHRERLQIIADELLRRAK